MADYQVTCTTKDGADPDRRIDALGGPTFAVSPIDHVIHWIKNGHTFWVEVQRRRVEVVLRSHAGGREYLTTEGDGFPPNNLLNLPNCP